MSPKFAGAPEPIRLSDWLLVEWVANAAPGTPFPEPHAQAHSPLQSIVIQLVDLGVMELPAPGTPVADIARAATTAAKRWLEQHPRPEPKPVTSSPATVRGRSYGR